MTRGQVRADPIQAYSSNDPNAFAYANAASGRWMNACFRLDWIRSRRSSLRIFVGAACGVWALSYPVAGQEGPGDQIFKFGINQKFSGTDNIRLDNNSVGTTYSSDTKLSFGFSSQTQAQTLDFSMSGVARLIDDPLIGTDSGFRDPTLALLYSRDSANSRLTVSLDYARPDLAFLDPLTQDDLTDQDFFRGGGTREDTHAGIRLETGLLSPLGFEFDLNSTRRSYSNTTDPLLFSNQTDSAAVATLFRFSPITVGRLDLYESRYFAEDTRQNEVKTDRFTFGLDHEFSRISALSVNIGHSEVVETFNTLPGLESVTRGPVGDLSLTRLMPNGEATARLDTTLNQQGRQNTLEFGRVFELPVGGLAISFGTTNGDTFSLRPIGRIDYTADLPTGALNASISREATISDTLSQATETTRVDFGYRFYVNDVSSLSFDLSYADISLVGNTASGNSRERGSFNATYSRDITPDWDVRVGYEYRYFNSTAAGSANSNSIFFALQRDVNVFR